MPRPSPQRPFGFACYSPEGEMWELSVESGDELQSQLPGHWRGVRTLNNLWKSDLLPSTVVLLREQHRSKDPTLLNFWERARDENASLLLLVREAVKIFTAPGPYDVVIVLSHRKRRLWHRTFAECGAPFWVTAINQSGAPAVSRPPVA